MNTYTKNELKNTLKKNFTWLTSFGFSLHQSDTYIRISNNILQGIYFQASENKRAICITLFIQPLFIQFSTIMLSYGFRMDFLNKNKEEWIELNNNGIKTITDYIKKYGIDFFENHSSVNNILNTKNIKKYKLIWEQNVWTNTYCLAFCYADINDKEFCKSKIKEFRENYSNYNVPWMKERLEEINELERALNEDRQKQLLEDICNRMKKTLKLK